MGYRDAAAMNAQHDELHASLCRWLGISSHSMACARGEPYDTALAEYEETAVLYVQRLIARCGLEVPA